MDRRLLIGLIVIISAGAIVLLVVQSQNLTQTQGALEAARADATDALAEAATAQAVALAEAADAAATAQSVAVVAAQAVEATAQSQALSQADDEAATAQAQAASTAAAQLQAAQDENDATATALVDEALAAQEEAAAALATQAEIALNNAVTATVAQGEAVFQAGLVQTQAAISDALATDAAISGAEVVALQEQLLTAQAAALPTLALLPGVTPDAGGTIPGWQLVEGDGFTIQLPMSFIFGDPERDLGPIVEQLQILGSEFEPFIQMLEQNPELFVLFAIDVENAEFLTNVLIGRQEIPFANLIPMETYLDLSVGQLPSSLTVVESSVIEIGGREAGRLVIESELVPNMPTRQVQYTFLTDTAAWFITYTTSVEEWEDRLPIFEKSVETLVINE